jgi:microcystin-dependent protein
LLCDGSEIEQVKFLDLYDTIGNTYGTASIGFGTFKLPDLRGRFPLGRDNMDNNLTVPTGAGVIVDAGGGNADRVNDTNADNVGGNAGQSSVTLTLGNLPDHSHNMIVNNIQYSAVRIDTTINAPGRTGLGPTAPGQAQYLDESGPIKKPSSDFTLSTPVGIMNPYLTINYIIRSGPPRF